MKLLLIVVIRINILACSVINYASAQYSYPRDNIKIGLVTDRNAEEMLIVFNHAIEMANGNLSILLTSITENVDYGDSFQGYAKLCRMLQTGVGGIFGPSSRHTAAHLMTVCDAKDIPYIHSHLTENVEDCNLYPHPSDLAKALHAILSAFEWSRFVFLYESAEYLNILNGILSLYENNPPTIWALRYDMQPNGNYKDSLRRVRKSPDTRIVVVGSTETMPSLLKQAQQIGIINEDYKYIIGNLDFHSFNLEDYKHSEANITSLRMFSPEQPEIKALMEKLGHLYMDEDFRNGSCPITMEMALTYDAVQLFAETTKHLSFRPIPLNCSDRSDSVRDDGSTFKNYMRSANLINGTCTGKIFFENNIRKGYTFDVIELQRSGIVRVGSWNEVNNYTSERLSQTSALFDISSDNSLANKTFVVLLSVPNKPYASLVESFKKLEGNDQYEGYGVDLIKELADKLGFNYTFINGGNDYGSFNSSTNVSTGMLKEIREGRADLAVTDLTITSQRQEAVEFSIPFMNLGIAILYIQPQKDEPALFSFMDPFASDVWWWLVVSFFGTSFFLFILGRLSPSEWDNPLSCVEEPTELENQFTIGNCLWLTTGALLQQGSDIAPRALSTRTLASIWWFFTLIMVSSYTANLAAFLTIENPTSPIETVEDLSINKGGVQYGAKRTGSTRNFFVTSEEEIYKKMNAYMEEHQDLLMETNMDGVDRVKTRRDYAFLMESTSIEYNTMRECNLKKVGSALDEKTYGIAMRKNWPYRNKINNALLTLQEQGTLAKMKNKWWNEIGAGICGSSKEGSDASALKMQNFRGVYLVLVLGSALAILYGICTWLMYVYKKAKQSDMTLKETLSDELKIVLDFQLYTRELRRSGSESSQSRHSSVNSLD